MKNLFPGLLVIFVNLSAYAQQTVSGNIQEAGTGTPLPGVSVLIKGTAKGVNSDFNGNFTLDDLESTDIIVFSYIGFKTQEITVGDQTQLVLTEYLACKDAGTFVILKELTDNYMNIALGIHTEPSIIDKPTLLFHMSLTAE